MLKNTSAIARAGVIAGLYVVLTLITFPIASTEIQFRPSEGLTLLALFLPESIPALFVGCMISNLITGCQILDVIFGGIITLVAGICTFGIGKIIKKATCSSSHRPLYRAPTPAYRGSGQSSRRGPASDPARRRPPRGCGAY